MSDIVKVNLKGIDWDIDGCEDYEQDCEKDSYWVEELSTEYGFCINGVDEVEIVE